MDDPNREPTRRWLIIPGSWLDAQRRERNLLLAEFGQVRGFLPMLMKHRNGQEWTAQERAQMIAQIRLLSHLSPYLVVLVLPGSFIALPALAWWLDRRRQHRNHSAA